jgi:arylsulfatase
MVGFPLGVGLHARSNRKKRLGTSLIIRSQYYHVTDVVPTILEVCGLPAPTSVNGVSQMPMHGTSLAYSFTDAKAKSRKPAQYYEMLGSRAIWADGWTAVAWHKKDTPWEEDRWELYHTEVDFTQANDLAAKQPAKLQELIALWEREARKYNVFPLDDRRYERVADPTRPVAALARKQYTYSPGTSILHPLAAPQILGVEHTITAHVTIPAGGAEGVLACSGGEFGGWTLFLKNGRVHYVHNYLKLDHFMVSSEEIPPGQHTLSLHVTPTEKHLKTDYSLANVTLSVNGQPQGELRGIKVAGQYSAVTGYGLLIGRNTGTPVSPEYKAPFAFTGKLDKVTIDLK